MDCAFGYHLMIYMARFGTIAHADSHLVRPVADAANDEQEIIDDGTTNEHGGQQRENPRHAARTLVLFMVIAQRSYEETEVHTSLLQLFLRQVFALHLLYLRLQVVRADALSQTDVAHIAVVAHPVVATVVYNLRNGRHRHHHLHAM